MSPRLPAAAAVATLALSLAAPAGATVVAPAGSGANAYGGFASSAVNIANTPTGGALLTWAAKSATAQSVQTSELAASGSFGPVQTVLEAPNLDRSPYGAIAADGSAIVVTATGSKVPTDVVAVRRSAGATSFGPPVSLTTQDFVSLLAVASNARGDVAVIYSDGSRRAQLVTAPAGGAFGAPQSVAPADGFVQQPAVAVAADGALAVAYSDGTRAYARSGAVGSLLQAPQTLATTRNYADFGLAFDGAGTATVAFSRSVGKTGIGIAAARATAGHPFGTVRTLDHGPNAQRPEVAAAGATTAISWVDVASTNGPRVVITKADGSFGRTIKPGAPQTRLPGEAGRYPSQSGTPALAVDDAGDVLIAYSYGPYGSAVHAVLHRAGSNGFGAPRVISALGHGGNPSVALLADRRPLIAFTDGDSVFGYTSLGSTPVDRTPASLTMSALSEKELRSRGRVTITVRCGEDCFVGFQGRMTTGRFRHGDHGQVISRPGRAPAVLKAGRSLTVRLALTAKGKQALAESGRGQVRVLATMTNRSGASRTVRRTLDFGR